jgi:hypothetical protein
MIVNKKLYAKKTLPYIKAKIVPECNDVYEVFERIFAGFKRIKSQQSEKQDFESVK